MKVTFTRFFFSPTKIVPFRATHHTALMKVTLTCFLSPPVALPLAVFTLLPVCSACIYPSNSLLLHLGPLPGTAHFSVKIKAEGSSSAFVSYCNTTWCHNPEDLDLDLHCHENLKSLICAVCFLVYLLMLPQLHSLYSIGREDGYE
jgi:hypothetical protein